MKAPNLNLIYEYKNDYFMYNNLMLIAISDFVKARNRQYWKPLQDDLTILLIYLPDYFFKS